MYVIWTEDKNALDVMKKATLWFGGDNLVRGQGHYNGKGEDSLRIEIFDDRRPNFAKRVYGFAQWIIQHNDQESVAVQRQDDPELLRNGDYDEEGNWTGWALPSVIRNEFGIEQLDEPEGVYQTEKQKGDVFRQAHKMGSFLDGPHADLYAKTPTVELPPADTSDIENPFGAIDMETACWKWKQFSSIPDEWVTCHMNSGHGRYAHFRNQNCIEPKRHEQSQELLGSTIDGL